MKVTHVALLSVVFMMVGMVNSASALFTSTTELDRYLLGKDTIKWSMGMPADFNVPYDKITSAELTIYSNQVNENNDIVSVQNIALGFMGLGTLKFDTTSWNLPHTSLEVSSIPIAAAQDPWALNYRLFVSLSGEEGFSLDPVFLDRAVLKLDYKNESAPVPEPGSMVLLGIGMLGLVIYGKRRMNRDG